MYYLSNFSKNNNSLNNAENNKNQRNKLKGIGQLAAAGYIGQKTVRSSIPRILGVRLESHSTSNERAKEILKGGGYIDPNKSGSSAIRSLEGLEDVPGVTPVAKAKNKVYITGVHKKAGKRSMGLLLPDDDPLSEDPLTQVLKRADRRRGYRAQSLVDWDALDKEKSFSELKDINKEIKKLENTPKAKTPEYFDLIQKRARLIEERGLNIQKARVKASIEGLLPWKGRSLYIGGSDEFFNKNFKPDFDDVRALYSDKKVKVFGNRAAATLDAIRREGLPKLIKGNPKRVLAGAAILAGGGLASQKLVKEALQNLKGKEKEPSDQQTNIKVGGFLRKHGGKVTPVKGFYRKRKAENAAN
jgi:hypothetical protein